MQEAYQIATEKFNYRKENGINRRASKVPTVTTLQSGDGYLKEIFHRGEGQVKLEQTGNP